MENFTGKNLIGGKEISSQKTFKSYYPNRLTQSEISIHTATEEQIDLAVQQAETAFMNFKNISIQKRSDFISKIANLLESNREKIVETAQQETGLTNPRLMGELTRTCNQLSLFANLIKSGIFLDARLDPALPERQPPRPDLRLINQPIGPIAVFGASNFPLAFSVAGGDTASALAAGCSVVVKGHEAHPMTSEIVGKTINQAAEESGIHPGVFSLLQSNEHSTGASLVLHPKIKAVGFTGSQKAGRHLFNLTQNRPQPIPFYGEMGSVNPIFFLPSALKDPQTLIPDYLNSLTLSAGQFCTNPGIAVLLKSNETDKFLKILPQKVSDLAPQTMLTPSICRNYHQKLKELYQLPQVEVLLSESSSPDQLKSQISIAKTSADHFIAHPSLQEEIFGPHALCVVCETKNQMLLVAQTLSGQLTASLFFQDESVDSFHQDLVEIMTEKVGRLILNQYPTGVEVSHAMMHGGPYPASTNPLYTSVGMKSIERFLRPITYQNMKEELLPQALQSDNPLNILRTINGTLTREKL